MTIYEIDQQIQTLIDTGVDGETGEFLFDPETLEALQMERDQKVENLALAYKNMQAEVKEIKDEETNLAQRRKALEAKADRAKEYLEYVLAGEKFKTARVVVGYRKSTKLELADGFTEWAAKNAPDFLRYKDPEPDKTAITAAIKNGAKVQGAALVENTTITVK